jgi:hypothetical protein
MSFEGDGAGKDRLMKTRGCPVLGASYKILMCEGFDEPPPQE